MGIPFRLDCHYTLTVPFRCGWPLSCGVDGEPLRLRCQCLTCPLFPRESAPPLLHFTVFCLMWLGRFVYVDSYVNFVRFIEAGTSKLLSRVYCKTSTNHSVDWGYIFLLGARGYLQSLLNEGSSIRGPFLFAAGGRFPAGWTVSRFSCACRVSPAHYSRGSRPPSASLHSFCLMGRKNRKLRFIG